MNQHISSANDSGAASAQRPSRFAFIQASWHREIVDQSRDAFRHAVADSGRAVTVDFLSFPAPMKSRCWPRSLPNREATTRSSRLGWSLTAASIAMNSSPTRSFPALCACSSTPACRFCRLY